MKHLWSTDINAVGAEWCPVIRPVLTFVWHEQVTFGICGDYLGRKKIYLVTLILMIACTIGQCFAASPFKGIG